MKFLNPKVHGVLDYLLAIALLLAPSVLGLSEVPSTILYVAGVAQIAMSLLTAYPLGIARIIPFTVHGWMELGVALIALAAPWVFGFAWDETARNFFLAFGGLLGLVWLTTNYKAALPREERLGRRTDPLGI